MCFCPSGTQFGDVFGEIAVSLSTKGFVLPIACSNIKYGKKPIDSASADENFVQGINFLEFNFPESSLSDNTSDREQIPQTDQTLETVIPRQQDLCLKSYVCCVDP